MLCFVPNIVACFCIDVAQVLALPLLWAAFEGDMSRNFYTFPIILFAHVSDHKRKWVEDVKSSIDNQFEKIRLAVQQVCTVTVVETVVRLLVFVLLPMKMER